MPDYKVSGIVNRAAKIITTDVATGVIRGVLDTTIGDWEIQFTAASAEDTFVSCDDGFSAKVEVVAPIEVV